MIKSIGRGTALAMSASALAITAMALPAGMAAASTKSRGAAQARPQAKSPPQVSETNLTAFGGLGWRPYHVVSVRGRSVLLTGLDAVSSDDAWVTGESGLASS